MSRPFYVKKTNTAGGTQYKSVTDAFIKRHGEYKKIKLAYVKKDGVWKHKCLGKEISYVENANCQSKEITYYKECPCGESLGSKITSEKTNPDNHVNQYKLDIVVENATCSSGTKRKWYYDCCQNPDDPNIDFEITEDDDKDYFNHVGPVSEKIYDRDATCLRGRNWRKTCNACGREADFGTEDQKDFDNHVIDHENPDTYAPEYSIEYMSSAYDGSYYYDTIKIRPAIHSKTCDCRNTSCWYDDNGSWFTNTTFSSLYPSGLSPHVVHQYWDTTWVDSVKYDTGPCLNCGNTVSVPHDCRNWPPVLLYSGDGEDTIVGSCACGEEPFLRLKHHCERWVIKKDGTIDESCITNVNNKDIIICPMCKKEFDPDVHQRWG